MPYHSGGLKNLIRAPAYALCGPVLYDKLQFLRANHYWPNYEQPRSFNEKTCHRKFYDPPKNAHIICDKWAVRDYVKARVGEGVLNEFYFIGDDLSKLPWNALPQRFFAKGTHGSGAEFMIRVEDKSQWTFEQFRKKAQKILDTTFGYYSNEPWLQALKPQILIEKYMEDKTYRVTPDYKSMVFHGRVQWIAVVMARFDNIRATFYDRDWQRADFNIKRKDGPDVPRPDNLEEILTVAEKLSADYDYMRVDLYNPQGKIVFGEMTPCYAAGWDRFIPLSYDYIVGEKW